MKSKLTRYFTIGQVAHESKDGKYMMSDEVIPVVEKLENKIDMIISCYESTNMPLVSLMDLLKDIRDELKKENNGN